MLDAEAIERTAHRLADAFVTATALAGVEALGDDAPSTAAEGYAVQARMREIAGIEVAAWKVGATSEAAQGLLGVDAPFLGGVSSNRMVASGHAFSVSEWFAGGPAIEIEVGLRPTADLTDVPDDALELAEQVEVVPCIEVVDSRFGAIIGPPGACLIADNGVASALVVGDVLDLDSAAIRGLGSMPVRLDIAGRDPIEGVASMALGHPLEALATAARIANELGRPIRAGEAVSTGTCTGLTPVEPGLTVTGSVGTGTITASFA